MKQHHLINGFLLILTVLLIAACGTAPPAEPTSAPADTPGESDAVPGLAPVEPVEPGEAAATTVAAPTAEPLPEVNPPPPQEVPELATLSPDYPAPPTLMAVEDPYPGGMVWIIRPVGVQCEEGTAEGYGDLHEAIVTLTAAGMVVSGSEMIELAVATSCGSPTSAHYRLQIPSVDLDEALSMGWEKERS